MATEPSNGFAWFADHWQVVLQHPLVVSLLGSSLAVWHAFPGATLGVKLVNGLSCFIVGIYAGPAINEWWGTQSPRVGALVILGCAIGGLVVVNGFLDYLRNTKFADLPFVSRLLGTQPAPPPAPAEKKE